MDRSEYRRELASLLLEMSGIKKETILAWTSGTLSTPDYMELSTTILFATIQIEKRVQEAGDRD